jgi:hypothetical protein
LQSFPSHDLGQSLVYVSHLQVEVVSLGGRTTEPSSLHGGCSIVNANVAAGYGVRYADVVLYGNDDNYDPRANNGTIQLYVTLSPTPILP